MGMVEQIKALENGNGLQYLLNAAFLILHNPMYIIDAEYNLLAFNDAPVDDPIWTNLIETGTYSLEALELLAKERFIEETVNAKKTTALESETLRCKRLSGHVYLRNGAGIGLVVMYECFAPFDTEAEEAFEAFTEKVSAEVSDCDYFALLSLAFNEESIKRLLDGTNEPPLVYNPRAQVLYDGFADYLYVAVVHVPRQEMLETVHKKRLAYCKSFLKAMFPSCKFALYGDYVVMLTSAKDKVFDSAPFYFTHADMIEQNNLYIGVSGSFENLYDLRTYYGQAVSALENGLAKGDKQRVFVYQE